MSRKAEPNEAVHGTAARVRVLLNLKSRVWAAARDGGRWADKNAEARQVAQGRRLR